MYKVFFGNRYLVLASNVDDVMPADGFNAIFKYSTPNELRQFVDKFSQRLDLVSGCIYYHDLAMLWEQFCALFRRIDAAGGVVENANGDILVIDRLGMADLPKGKAEANETPEQTAVREVGEETGLHGIVLGRHLVDTYHTYTLGDDVVLKRTVWYAMHVEGVPSLVPQAEENITNANWVAKRAIEDIKKKTYASVREVFAAL